MGGDSAHRSAYTDKGLGIRKMSWPTSSPGLSPIENVWAMLKKQRKKRFRKRRPHNPREVVEVARGEWEKLPWKRICNTGGPLKVGASGPEASLELTAAFGGRAGVLPVARAQASKIRGRAFSMLCLSSLLCILRGLPLC